MISVRNWRLFIGPFVFAPMLVPNDLWIGVYIKGHYYDGGQRRFRAYIAPLPMLVLMVDTPA